MGEEIKCSYRDLRECDSFGSSKSNSSGDMGVGRGRFRKAQARGLTNFPISRKCLA